MRDDWNEINEWRIEANKSRDKNILVFKNILYCVLELFLAKVWNEKLSFDRFFFLLLFLRCWLNFYIFFTFFSFFFLYFFVIFSHEIKRSRRKEESWRKTDAILRIWGKKYDEEEGKEENVKKEKKRESWRLV